MKKISISHLGNAGDSSRKQIDAQASDCGLSMRI